MKYKLLRPNQIITLSDYPVHNEQILKIYFRVFSKNQGKILPPCPVIHKSSVKLYSTNQTKQSKNYNKRLADFLKNNPEAEYFLIDGSHKTTAANLSCKLIPVVVIEHDEDLIEVKKLIKKGEFFGWYSVDASLRDIAKGLIEHHLDSKEFLTVDDKTKRMIKDRIIPAYMISFYKTNR